MTDLTPDEREAVHIVTFHENLIGLVWSCTCRASGAGYRRSVEEAGRRHAAAHLAERVEAATADAHAAGVAEALLAMDPCHGGEEQHTRHLDVCVPFHDLAAHLLTDDVVDAIERLRDAALAGTSPQGGGVRTTCGAGLDGECYADGCVQRRDGEPDATGRFCPLPPTGLVAFREAGGSDPHDHRDDATAIGDSTGWGGPVGGGGL